jgi:hypothetical protein
MKYPSERDMRLLAAVRKLAEFYPPGQELLRREIVRKCEQLFPNVKAALGRLEKAGHIKWRREGRGRNAGYRLLLGGAPGGSAS